ncbi:hypothetical protein ACFQZQ_14025 [Lysobacter koreensis]|uniref:Uncharacterized protein n=1 Tax=Lysobacter koreensis TaxID=266122 RepID=A0ABW2YSV3_9GAMM
MSQNLASKHFDDAQWSGVDQAIAALEQSWGPVLVALNGTAQRRSLIKMGDGSEAFCRKAFDVMRENADLLPRNLDLAEMGRDLASHDALNARLQRLTRLLEKVRDTDMALGSDVMVAALGGYAILKVAGKGEGLDAVNRDLGKRFEGNGPRAVEPGSVSE